MALDRVFPVHEAQLHGICWRYLNNLPWIICTKSTLYYLIFARRSTLFPTIVYCLNYSHMVLQTKLTPGLATSWLTQKVQRVVIDGAASGWLPVKSGVPHAGNGFGATYVPDLHQ